MKVACIYFEKNQDIQSLAEIFYRATPQIMLREEKALLLDISGCTALYSEAKFIKRVLATLQRLHLKATVTIGGNVSEAMSLAHFKVTQKDDLPIDALKFYVDPLGKDPELLNKMGPTILLLKKLGLEKLRDFTQLPARDINSRFGALGLVAYLKVNNQYDTPWLAFKPREQIEDRFEFDPEHPVQNLEPIYFRLNAMLDRLNLRLRGQGKRLKQFDLVLKQEHTMNPNDLYYKIPILLQLPYVSQKVIFQITKERLEAEILRQPLKARVIEFAVKVTETIPYFMNQKNLFDQKKEESEESLFQLVSRIATRLGKNQVFYAQVRESFIPEKSWKKHTEYKAEQTEHKSHAEENGSPATVIPERPFRLFSQPLEVEYSHNHLLVDHHKEEIQDISHSEVIFSDWWENPLERIYYRLTTKSGRKLWLFKSAKGHFLHGVFD